MESSAREATMAQRDVVDVLEQEASALGEDSSVAAGPTALSLALEAGIVDVLLASLSPRHAWRLQAKVSMLSKSWCHEICDWRRLCKDVTLPFGLEQIDGALAGVARDCPRLESLTVHDCSAVRNQTMIDLLASCPCLLHLDLYWAYKLSGGFVQQLATRFPRLRSLRLRSAPMVYDVDIGCLASGCEELHHLDLERCSNVTSVVAHLVLGGKFPKLQSLGLQQCRHVTSHLYQQALQHLEQLMIDRTHDEEAGVSARTE
jgi:hypothetical protein